MMRRVASNAGWLDPQKGQACLILEPCGHAVVIPFERGDQVPLEVECERCECTEEHRLVIFQRKIDAIHVLIEEVRAHKQMHPEDRVAHTTHPGSILNAYREGDLTFDEAVAELQRAAARP